MRLSTPIHLVIRDVGRANSGEDLYAVHGPLKDVIKDLIQYLASNQLNRRFDICIGRDREECETRLRLEAKSPKAQGSSLNAELDNIFDSMFGAEELAAAELPQGPEDTYVASR